MAKNILQYLNEIATFSEAPVGKINLNEDSVPTRVINNKSASGFLNIIFSLLPESKSNLTGSDLLEKAEVRQWLEYALVYCESNNFRQILKELNGILATKTYLVAYRLTIADVLLYYVLLNIMGTLNNVEKEKYTNVSRWFDNLQQNSSIRQSHKLVDFSTNYLSSVVPSRH